MLVAALFFYEPITKERAVRAYRWLVDEALKEFVFKTKYDLAAAVCGLITPIARPFLTDIGGFPGFLSSAPVQGTGKSAYCSLLFLLNYGRAAVSRAYVKSPDELRKSLTAINRQGIPAFVIDNIPGPFLMVCRADRPFRETHTNPN